MEKVIIIGAGHGGVQVASSLRSEGFQGSILVIAKEPEFPYQKPPLSKDFLKGKIGEANLAFRSIDFYQKNNIDLALGVDIQRVDTDNQKVIATNGKEFLFDQLILATGADNRILRIEGSHLEGIHYLRTLSDAQVIQSKLESAQKIAVVGGGFIGLELAAAAVVQGKDVTVIEAQDRLMARVLPPLLTDVFQREHEANGVKFRFNSFANAYQEEAGRATGVNLKDGSFIEADLILVGIGVIPNTALAEAANLDCDNGIVVNEFMQTSNPSIFSVGDCANHYNPFAGKRTRLESVQNAVDQAKTVAKFITGNPEPYNAVPWFWTNQYQLKLQMAGFNTDYDEYVIRGELDDKKFSIFYYKDQKLTGVDSLNKPSDHLGVRKLLQAGVSPDQTSISDTTIKVKAHLPQ